MRDLINFILRNTLWLLFIFLVFISVMLLVNNQQYQRSKYLTWANELTGSVQSVSGSFFSYWNLRRTNAELTERIADLETQVYAYQQLQAADSTIRWDQEKLTDISRYVYLYRTARVVNNSTSGVANYITLNKGSKQGIEQDMGVLSPGLGVVGVVMSTSPNYSIVIPLVNRKSSLSSKVKKNNAFGTLAWDGKDPLYSYLEELPSHIELVAGDTIVTSGHSAIFPEGIPVGTVVESSRPSGDNYVSAKVKLFTDFSRLSEVLIVGNSYRTEQIELEQIDKR